SAKRNMQATSVPAEKIPLGMEGDEAPKLERQLTSTFDDEMMDLARSAMTEVESPSPAGSQTVTNTDELPSMENLIPNNASSLVFLTGEATDIGGGHENQDRSMCFRTGPNEEHLVMAVFDGHGKELGQLAAIVARDFMKT